MALKKITEDPRITDTILFEIETPDVDGCFTDNPYKVDSVIVYYVERNYLGDNHGEYERLLTDPKLQLELEEAEKVACDDPSADNLFKVQELKGQIESSSKRDKFYFKDRMPIKVVGSEGFPAWLSTDTENSPLVNVEEDEDGNPQFGHFIYEWNPQGGIREGDYFVCWTWTPLPAGDSLSAHLPFTIFGDPSAVTTLPTHITPEIVTGKQSSHLP